MKGKDNISEIVGSKKLGEVTRILLPVIMDNLPKDTDVHVTAIALTCLGLSILTSEGVPEKEARNAVGEYIKEVRLMVYKP